MASHRRLWSGAALTFAFGTFTAAPSAALGAEASVAPSFDAVVERVDETRAQDDYDAALELVEAGRYANALSALRRVQASHPDFSALSAVQTRVAVLHEAADAGDALPVFLDALDARDAGRLDEALTALDWIADGYAENPLLDDALYLGAYLALMDGYDFPAAAARLDRLSRRAPDSAYRDSADYLNAIVQEQLGDTASARMALEALRERHTALVLPFGFRWPAGTLLSRYWFDRADRRIALIDRRLENATRISRREPLADGRLRVAVNVDGIDMQLLLGPSALVRDTAWRDARLLDRLPPDIGVYEGEVDGASDSWVRAVIDADGISGMIELDGIRHRLLPDDLTGTLDYYQPASRRRGLDSFGDLDPADPGLAARLQAIDLLAAPPRAAGAGDRRSRSALTETRSVPMSIVVDSRFDGYHAGGGLARALEYLNVADGVYREHGLSLMLDEAITFSDDADPLKLEPGTLESFLRGFRAYRLAQSTLFADSAVTYLFTGNRKTDPTLGLAWIDTLCRTDGYDVGVTTPSSFGDVLLTHELGHSFGSKHDSDTECSDDRDALMWPHISAGTATRLSSCSEVSVANAHSRSCLANAVDLALSATSGGGSVVFTIDNRDSALTLDARLLVETGLPDQLEWLAGCRLLTPTSADCPIVDLFPGEKRTVSFALRAEAGGDAEPIGGRVLPVGIAELAPADNEATTNGLALASLSPALDASAADPVTGLPADDPPAGGSSGSGAGSGGGAAGASLIALALLRRWRLRTSRGPTV